MNLIKLIRQNILNLQPYKSARDLFNNPEFILLDANENNFGTTFNGLPELKLNRYPDPSQNELRVLISEFLNVSKEQLFFGVGSDEIIDLLIRIFCEPGSDNVIISEPTFGMYKVFCDINNVETKTVLLNDDFQLNINSIKRCYNSNTKIIFLCSPNNPTGNLINREDIIELCNNFNAIVVLDEAYIDFANTNSFASEVKKYKNLVVLRTFSKAWGLAGLRLGYCISDPQITEFLFKVKSPCNINSFARYAVKNAIKNSNKRLKYIQSTIRERERLKIFLKTLPGILKVYPSEANFLLIKVENAKLFQQKLLERGIVVRDRSKQPKLKNCLRISVGTKKENDLLCKALKEIL